MNCSCAGCLAEAVAAAVVNVPAVGMPIPEHDPIQLIFNLPLCALHLKECVADDLLSESHRFYLANAVRALNRAEPDFDRAFVTGCPFDSDAWKMLQEKENGPGNWDVARRERLRVAYQKAVQEQQETFAFDGYTLLVSYAKYLLEYLDQSL